MPEDNVILVQFVHLKFIGDGIVAEFKHPKKGQVYWTKGFIQDLLQKPLDPRNQTQLQKAIDSFSLWDIKKKKKS